MKKAIILLCLFLATTIQSINAQVLQGHVKTLGRPEKKGEALSGVTIRVKGEHNPVVTNNTGNFSMMMPNKKNGDSYSLQQVQKNGYELNDADMIGRILAFSDKVPLNIVMVSLEQLQADKQRIENNAYAVAQKNYKAQYDLLENQVNNNKITIKEYQEQIQDLQNRFERYQLLIDGLATHYAHTDYDELDEKDREINICIENGELERADSLLNTIDLINKLKADMEALERIKAQIELANKDIAQANEDMIAVLKQQAKDAEYLYQLYTIALLQFDNKKAQFYIEKRAALDTTNAEWQIEAGYFLRDYDGNYDKALLYFKQALKSAQYQFGEENLWTIAAYSGLSSVCCLKGWFTAGDEYGRRAMDLSKTVQSDSLILVQALNNLGANRQLNGQYAAALDYYNRALAILQAYFGEEYNEASATLNHNLGLLFTTLGSYEMAYEHYLKALEARLAIYGDSHFLVGQTKSNIGELYLKLGQTEEALSCSQEGLTIRIKSFGELHPDVAESYNNIGYAYLQLGSLDESLSYLLKADSIYDQLNLEDPKVATCLQNIGNVYHYKRNFETSLSYMERSIIMFEQFLAPPHYELARVYFNTASVYYDNNDYLNSIVFIDKAVSMFEVLLDRNHPDLYTSYDLQWDAYNKASNKLVDQKDCNKAIEYYEKALYIYEQYIHQDERISRTIRENIEYAKKCN